ncbi:MAG: class I SAM-dependent methyltransferase, partial [Dehalococcoidia bacterium]
MWRCDRCRLVFPDPMPLPLRGLEQHYGVAPDDYFQHHDIAAKLKGAAALLRRAEELIGGSGRLLDIGAGRGEMLRAARDRGWSVVGVEPSSAFAAYARKYSGAAVRQDPVDRCNFAPCSFDAVILSAVLEHLYDPDGTVREASRVLRQGGVLFVDVPNEEGLYFRLGNLYQRMRRRDWVVNLSPTFSPFHTFGFGPCSLRLLLSKHGLEPVDWRVYGGSSSSVPAEGGALGSLERAAADLITTMSGLGGLGTYIET